MTFFNSIFKARRRRPQRLYDRSRFFYQDVYSANLLLIVLIIVSLSATDAILTLLILQKGGVELNPVMIWALEYSSKTFFITKYLLTAVGIFTLVVHVNFRIFRCIPMPHFLVVMLAFYAALIGYEFHLLLA